MTLTKHFLPLIILCTALVSCNKDGVIVPDDPDSPDNPDKPDVPVTPVDPDDAPSTGFDITVYEYTPAPGQFINDDANGMPQSISTMHAANQWAAERLGKGHFVSLGGFGGYIVVGLDRRIAANAGGYDFGIYGNAFVNEGNPKWSNEPGIVYVMQDTNGNGLPDDTWYELRGSDYDDPTTIHDYAVTYYRPAADGQAVRWTDNKGGDGTVDYIAISHKQPSYYPAWIAADSYTLKGSCLKNRNTLDSETGLWNIPPFGRGYADNMGEDALKSDDSNEMNRFNISDAVDADGNPVNLTYINFIKVQTGVNSKSGILGEMSTEVCGFSDL